MNYQVRLDDRIPQASGDDGQKIAVGTDQSPRGAHEQHTDVDVWTLELVQGLGPDEAVFEIFDGIGKNPLLSHIFLRLGQEGSFPLDSGRTRKAIEATRTVTQPSRMNRYDQLYSLPLVMWKTPKARRPPNAEAATDAA